MLKLKHNRLTKFRNMLRTSCPYKSPKTLFKQVHSNLNDYLHIILEIHSILEEVHNFVNRQQIKADNYKKGG